MPQPTPADGPGQSDAGASPDRWAQRIGMSVLGLAAVACVAGVVLVVVHRSTSATTAAITAMSALGSAAVGGIAGMLSFSGARQAPQPPSAPAGPGISLSPASGTIDAPLTISGSGFSPGETVALQFGTSPLTTATADGNGSFSRASAVPRLASAAYIVTASGQSSGSVAAAQFTIS